MTGDGRRIVLPVSFNIDAQTPLTLETNWMAEIKRQ
jgi:hypothetical protein